MGLFRKAAVQTVFRLNLSNTRVLSTSSSNAKIQDLNSTIQVYYQSTDAFDLPLYSFPGTTFPLHPAIHRPFFFLMSVPTHQLEVLGDQLTAVPGKVNAEVHVLTRRQVTYVKQQVRRQVRRFAPQRPPYPCVQGKCVYEGKEGEEKGEGRGRGGGEREKYEKSGNNGGPSGGETGARKG